MNDELVSVSAEALDKLRGLPVVGIGADVVDIDRIRAVVKRHPKFVDRIFTPNEILYCHKRDDPAERFAVRFAAKESVLKALGVGIGGADFTDIEVIRLPTGQPQLRLTGRAATLADEQGVKRWLITLSHAEQVAQAFVAGLGNLNAEN